MTSSRPECHRDADTVSGPRAAGSVTRTEPAANLRSGSSVCTCTVTSPRIPCGRPTRPTTSCMQCSLLASGARLANLVGVQEVDPDVRVAGQRADHGPQRPGGPSAAADDLAQVLWVDADLEHPAPPQPATVHADIVGELHDASDQVLEGLFEHVSLRSPTPSRRSRPRPGLRLARRPGWPPWRRPSPCRSWLRRSWRHWPWRHWPWSHCPW